MKKDKIRFRVKVYFTLLIMLIFIVSILLSYGFFTLLSIFNLRPRIVSMLWIFIISSVFASMFTSAVSKRFFKPVDKLIKAMNAISEGNFKVRIEENDSISEIKDINHTFNLMAEGLESTEILQSNFVSNVSHEFKTPINAIEGYSMLLQGATTDEERNRYIEKILLNTDRLSKLVGNILLLSKIDNQIIKSRQVKYRLDEQIRHAILLLEQEWTKKEIDFDIDLDPVTYFGNEDLLLHVWTNLLGNAIKFSPQNGLIKIRLRSNASHHVFSIEDRGPGIAPESVKYIFDRFYQGDSSHKEEGNGLGLALVKQILTCCCGNITVENLSKGCKFTVSLPYCP